MSRYKIISIAVDHLSFQECIETVARLARTFTPSYVCFANVHMIIEAYRKPDFAPVVNRAQVIAADGVPVAKAGKWLYGINQERVAGMDFMPRIIAECEKRGLSLYFFGSSPEILEGIRYRLDRDHPSLRVAGLHSPPFGQWAETNNQEYVRLINNSGAQVVLVSLGCPKQEKWMAQHSKDISAVLIGIGGVFEVYAGLRRRAPVWMQKTSLEWLYRLLQDPKRLLKRYFVTNTWFIGLLLREWLKKKSNKIFG